MTEIPNGGWLYTRGAASVRLVRQERSTGCHLFVVVPGSEVVIHEFANLAHCMKRQAEIEQNLLAAGYHLTQPSDSSEPRNEDRLWRSPDDRRAAS